MDKSIERIICRVLEEVREKGRDHLTQTEEAVRSRSQARSVGLRDPGGRAQAPELMTSDLDIYRTASVLVREHGDEAAFRSATRSPRARTPTSGLAPAIKE